MADEDNQSVGAAFLAENATRKAVTVLPSGLQYEVVAEGAGETPTASDTVVTHYRGTLVDGTEFDSSHSRGRPATFPVGRVIAGWREALQLMRVGATWRLFIPPELAYGERSVGDVIGPHSTLLFEIELLEIK